MCDFLEISKMAVQESTSNSQEIGMPGVVHLYNTPWVLSRSNLSPANFYNFLRTDNSEWHQSSEFSIFLNCILIIFFNVIRKVVHGDTVMFDIFHNQFLRFG